MLLLGRFTGFAFSEMDGALRSLRMIEGIAGIGGGVECLAVSPRVCSRVFLDPLESASGWGWTTGTA